MRGFFIKRSATFDEDCAKLRGNFQVCDIALEAQIQAMFGQRPVIPDPASALARPSSESLAPPTSSDDRGSCAPSRGSFRGGRGSHRGRVRTASGTSR